MTAVSYADFDDILNASLIKKRENQNVFNSLIQRVCQDIDIARPISKEVRGFYTDGHVYIRELYTPAGKEIALQTTYQQFFDRPTTIDIDPKLSHIKIAVLSGEIVIIGESGEKKSFHETGSKMLVISGKEKIYAAAKTHLLIMVKENNSRA